VYGPDAWCYKFYLLLQLDENNAAKELFADSWKATKTAAIEGPPAATFLEDDDILTNLDTTLK